MKITEPRVELLLMELGGELATDVYEETSALLPGFEVLVEPLTARRLGEQSLLLTAGSIASVIQVIILLSSTISREKAWSREELDRVVATALARLDVIDATVDECVGFENLLRDAGPCIVSATDTRTTERFRVYITSNGKSYVVRVSI
jgi:hypothetical protein